MNKRRRKKRVFMNSEEEKEKVSLDLISINFKSHFSFSTFFVVFSFLLFEWALTFSWSLLPSFIRYFFLLLSSNCDVYLTISFSLSLLFLNWLHVSRRGPGMRWMALFSNDVTFKLLGIILSLSDSSSLFSLSCLYEENLMMNQVEIVPVVSHKFEAASNPDIF